ncbi:MAG: Phytochrome-like protein cph2 [Dactylosporangium sp.]|jgi:EAL domain-containing protein (putative c-di-GMP-specific phosphodiesterase class I)|nr:Phytochrome-like protein cph2 [Dactylosporangium sp.]
MPTLFRRDRNDAFGGGTDSRPVPSTSGQKPPLEQAVRHRTIRAEYQPIVRLDSGEVVAFEALPCVPPGCPFDTPAAMFAAANEAGLRAELDQVAHAAAYRDALAARLHPSVSLFVKADPRELADDPPSDLAELVALALTRIRVFLEVDAQAMMAAPARTLAGIEKARANGWGIAWDRADDSPDAFALIPFVRPDLVKMSVAVARDHAQPDADRLVNAVRAYVETWGASIVVTDMACEEDLHFAVGIGASLGQGSFYALPGSLPAGTGAPRRPAPILRPLDVPPAQATPYEVLTQARQPASGTAQMLEQIADGLARRCAVDPEPPAVIVSLPSRKPLPDALLDRLTQIAPNTSFLTVITARPPAEPVPGIRFVSLPATDPLAKEWSLAIAGPYFYAFLTARDSGQAQEPFRYSHVLTYDRDLVLQGARALLSRLD